MGSDRDGRERVRRRPLVRFQLLALLAAVILAAPVVQGDLATEADRAGASMTGAR